jgi:DNA-binding transcriptional MerR regulator
MNKAMGSLSVREIARRTGVPESTLRYYRSLFAEYIPTVGAGRNRRHPEAAVSVFQIIAAMFAGGESRGTVRRELARGPLDDGPQVTRVVPDAEPGVGRPRYEIAVAPPAQLTSRDLEDLLTALLVRDRELAAMHRELLDMVGQLLHAIGRMAGANTATFDRPEMAIPAPPEARPETQPEARPAASDGDALELEQLRDNLTRERETVERLRKARLELEQRLSKLERERGKR